jgi:hypothetical protein
MTEAPRVARRPQRVVVDAAQLAQVPGGNTQGKIIPVFAFLAPSSPPLLRSCSSPCCAAAAAPPPAAGFAAKKLRGGGGGQRADDKQGELTVCSASSSAAHVPGDGPLPWSCPAAVCAGFALGSRHGAASPKGARS